MCDLLTGFGVRKSPKTRRVVFFVRRVVGGKEHRLRLGTHHELSVREARKLAAVRIWEIEHKAAGTPNLTPAPVLQVPPAQVATTDPRIDELLTLVRGEPEPEPEPAMTVAQLWERIGPGWIASVKPGTQRNIKCLFNARILPKWSDTPIDQIQTADLAKWYQTFLDTAPHYGAEATKKLIRLLRLGEEQGLIQSLPSFKISFTAPKQRQPMEETSVLKMVNALEDILKDDAQNPYARAVIAILNTGERALSGAELHTREVNYREKLITKRRKFDQIKKIPMSDYTVSFLRSIHPEGGGYYFPNRRDPSIPIKYSTLRLFLVKLVDKHGIRTVDGSLPTLHSIRHTYATLLEEQGLPISHIQRLLGHSSMQSTLRYIHGSLKGAREGANRLEITRARVVAKPRRKKTARNKKSSRKRSASK